MRIKTIKYCHYLCHILIFIIMRTDIQNTKLYKDFFKALGIGVDMRPDDNRFVVECCEIAKEYSKEALELLTDASKWIGHPATNISGSVDSVCADWREKYELFMKK